MDYKLIATKRHEKTQRSGAATKFARGNKPQRCEGRRAAEPQQKLALPPVPIILTNIILSFFGITVTKRAVHPEIRTGRK